MGSDRQRKNWNLERSIKIDLTKTVRAATVRCTTLLSHHGSGPDLTALVLDVSDLGAVAATVTRGVESSGRNAVQKHVFPFERYFTAQRFIFLTLCRLLWLFRLAYDKTDRVANILVNLPDGLYCFS